MKKFTIKWLLLSTILSIASINTMWAWTWTSSLGQAYLHCNFNGSAVVFDPNATLPTEYVYNTGDHATFDLGTLEAGQTFTLTYLCWHCWNSWGDGDNQHTDNYFWYFINDGSSSTGNTVLSQGWDGKGDFYPKQDISHEVASGNGASGNYTFNHGFYTKFWGAGSEKDYYEQKDLDNNGKNFKFTYTIMPPDVGTISVSATGYLAGDGTEGNPYIVAYGGDLILDITGATQEHTDANSSAQYSIDNSNWGTETANTRKTIPNVTSTTTSDWMVYARFHNGTASLTGEQKGKRIYYKAESRYNVTATASLAAGGTVSPVSASNVGQYSGVDIEATPYVGYKFNGWSVLTGNGSFESASSASTTFKPTAASTIQGAFVRTYAYVEGRFRVYNEERDDITTTYSSGSWDNNSRSIPMTYDSENHRFYLRTYMTLAEMTEEHTGTGCDDCKPYFYIKTSTSTSSWDNVIAYRPASGTTIVNATRDNGVDVASSGAENSIWFNNSSEAGYVVLYFDQEKVWYELEPAIFTAATDADWDEASNWSPAKVPNSETDVVLTKPVTVNINDARAKSVKIYNDGDTKTGKLTIGAGKALIVEEDIKKTTDGSTKIATTADVLHIEAGNTVTANGALVWGTTGTPGAAQVDFYTKSHGEKNSSASINQYIGTPFSDEQQILYQFYYSWMYKIARDGNKDLYWDLMASDEGMNPYEGYNLISAYAAGTTYQMEGTLVSNADMTLTTSTTPALIYSGSGTGASAKNENVLANSWVAPIKIASMDAANNFSNVEGSIYIFNAGTPTQYTGDFSIGTAGNYTCYTIETAGNNVIPSMQSFSVFTQAASPTIKFNYDAWVKTPLTSAYYNGANKAPKRSKADEMKLLKVRVQGENGWADEVKIYTHEEFSMDFEDSWDGHKMYGNPEAPQLYAASNDGALAISCVPTADNNVLGFTPGSEDSEYTFSFDYNGDEDLYLRDTKLNVETPINNESSYYFVSESNDSDMRFVIIKKAPAVVTGIDEIGDNVSGVQKIMHNGTMYIVRDGRIYNAEGALVK